MERQPKLIAVMGPTGSGKSLLAEWLAEQLDAQLISADAFQIYRGFDIGTNKPQDTSRYRMIDIRNPDENYGVGEYVLEVAETLSGLYSSGRNAVIVGGTGLYIRALMDEWKEMHGHPDPELRAELERQLAEHGCDHLVQQIRSLDPDVAASIDMQNPVRVRRALERLLSPQTPLQFSLPPYTKTKIALVPETAALNDRIASRTDSMLASGWPEEVQTILQAKLPKQAPAWRAIGYDFLSEYLEGTLDWGQMRDKIVDETRRYAKRQRTWIRSEQNVLRLEVPLPLAQITPELRCQLSILLDHQQNK
ncbi:MAG: tRNA (adenosine(37)-N6)-dimethylallyltransferase MiaA [Armatimonadetes bacterium]|nr:tRNA (adenosine(37)-N6)-dimethylallyltransferase MiaA [Armatimonadota bacterium]